MTTGGYDRSDFANRKIDTLTWTGTDRPKVQYAPRKRETVVRDGVTYRFLSARVAISRPTKRELDAPHPFSKSWNHQYQGDPQTYLNNIGATSTVTCISLGFSPGGLCEMKYTNGLQLHNAVFTANDDIALLRGLREKIYGSDFNLSVFLGEGHQALKLIADSATRIAKALAKTKRGDLVGAARELVNGTGREIRRHRNFKDFGRKSAKSTSNSWLELQYGWLPLLKDTHEAAQMLAHATHAPFQTTFRVSKTREKKETRTGGGSTPLDRRYYWSMRTTQRVRLSVIVREKPSAFYALGLQNPELVAWELLPFSFVVDWFIPIGQYLEARAATSAIAGTYITSSRISGEFTGVTGALLVKGAYARRGSFTRTVSTTPPSVPLPTFKGLGQIASWQHCANAIALLVSPALKGLSKLK